MHALMMLTQTLFLLISDPRSWLFKSHSNSSSNMACCTTKPGHSSYCQDRFWKDAGVPNAGFHTFEEVPKQSDVRSYSVGFGPYS
jgi:hypothetical protein